MGKKKKARLLQLQMAIRLQAASRSKAARVITAKLRADKKRRVKYQVQAAVRLQAQQRAYLARKEKEARAGIAGRKKEIAKLREELN
eukprot:5349466-Prymnesium_polylepis.1